MKSVMSHNFAQVPRADIPRSTFDRSHGLKTAFDADYIVPIFVDDVIPGDTANLQMSGFARLATPQYPIMDNMFMETFFFFVPNRLVWTNFKKMMGETVDPGDTTAYTTPTCPATAATGYGENSLQDYFGLPTKIPDYSHNNLPLRAYNLIYNEWFRDQNLQDSLTVDVDDGPDAATDYVLVKRGKRHDYFTSALPWLQKNNTGTDVTIPLGTSANIYSDQDFDDVEDGANYLGVENGAGGTVHRMLANVTSVIGSSATGVTNPLKADLTNATAATINQLRQAFAVQKLYERDARGGTRYTEIVRSHFGVTSPDARLQRPEYLGGGSSPINIQAIASTYDDGTNDSKGELGAFGLTSFNNHGFVKSFTEHGFIIGLVNVRADITYQEGLDRMWSRSDRLDYYWPALSMIGEQSILCKELVTVDPATDTGATGTKDNERTWAYQERYAEYRYKSSKITGVFRSNATTSLESWHLSEVHTDAVTTTPLAAAFITSNAGEGIDRAIKVASEPHFIMDCHFDYKMARPMPLFGVPGLIDHF